MARIVADRGRQRTLDGGGRVAYEFIFEMDCGCDVRVPERAWMSGTRSSGVDLRGRLERVADAHDCDVVVHHAPEWHRREVRARSWLPGRDYPPIRYMGMDAGVSPGLSAYETIIQAWGLGSRPRVAAPAPALEAPEQVVRRATEQLQAAQSAPVGFKVETPKKEPDRPKDRFELIELD